MSEAVIIFVHIFSDLLDMHKWKKYPTYKRCWSHFFTLKSTNSSCIIVSSGKSHLFGVMALLTGHQNMPTSPLQRVKVPQWGPPVGCGWWPMMPRVRILVFERFGGQSLALPLLNTPLWPLHRLDGWSDRPDPINQLVRSSFNIFSNHILQNFSAFKHRWIILNAFQNK